MKKLFILAIICIISCILNTRVYAEAEIKPDFSKLKNKDINIYRILLRGVATSTNSFSEEKNECENELYISQLVRDVNKAGNIIIQTNIDSEKSFINGDEVNPSSLGSMYFTEMDKFGNVISSVVESGQKNSAHEFQLSFPDKKMKIGYIWTRKVVIEKVGKKYPVECKYKITGFEKISGKNCVKIESVSSYKGDPRHSMETKGIIYFNLKRSIIEKSVVSSFIKSEATVQIGGIESKNKYSVFLTVTTEHIE